MNLTNEQIEKMLEGAPDWQKCYCTESKQRFPYDNYRNLSDLREILTLRQRVEELEQRNDELAATVERLRDACTSQRKHLKGTIATLRRQLNECESLLCRQQNINAVKREVYKRGYIDGYRLLLESVNGIAMHNYYGMAESCANTKYPSVKE